jgi:hypothetical protein
MTPELLARALMRTEGFLLGSFQAEGMLARIEGEISFSADADDAAAFAAELRREQASDGSWGGDLVRTAEALLVLEGLRRAGGQRRSEPAAGAAIRWLAGRQDQPGRFGDGCSPERHELGLCHHFLAGFFSPAPPEVEIAPLVLPAAVRIGGEADARLAASCLALRALRRWEVASTANELHLDGIVELVGHWDRWETGPAGAGSLLVALGALVEDAAARDRPHPHREAALRDGLRRTARNQRADGSWPDVDTFLALELLLDARSAGRGDAVALDAALGRGAELLAVWQRQDGTWGHEAAARRALIAWRVLRYAARTGPAGSAGASVDVGLGADLRA